MKYVLALLAGALLCAPALSQEHGDPAHFWISANPNYLRKSGTHCCGPGHCRVVPGDFLKAVVDRDIKSENYGQIVEWYVDKFADTRYGVQRFRIGQPRALYESKDTQNWACVDDDGEVHCIFTKRVAG